MWGSRRQRIYAINIFMPATFSMGRYLEFTEALNFHDNPLKDLSDKEHQRSGLQRLTKKRS
jgi:hypothetical protein